jgi:Holliday junction DNA helicase RuvA
MIARLHGTLVAKVPQHIVVDVRGVGYGVSIPLSTFYRLPDEGADLTLLVHTHVREDAISLFGFLTADERALFERLIAVSGVGPKLALAILSGIEPPDLVEALRSGDVARLVRIPGVGRKTAERLVLELRDKLPPAEPGPVRATSSPSHAKDDLLAALTHLGYSRPEAERAVARAHADQPDGRFESLLRRSLQVLSGR